MAKLEDEWEADLTSIEMMVGSYVGSARHVQALFRKFERVAGSKDEDAWNYHIEGAQGEIAVAKRLGIYWAPAVNDHTAPDVGPYQVRTNLTRRVENMILRPKDENKKDKIFISVLSFAPRFKILGWIYGHQAMIEKWKGVADPNRPPCYLVPREALEPMSRLP